MTVRNFFIASLFTLFIQQAAAAPIHMDQRPLMAGVAAVVNNDIVTTTELGRAVALAKQRIISSGQALPKEDELESAVLHHLIDLRLQLQLAKRLNVSKSEADVDKAVARIKARQKMSDKEFQAKLEEEGRSEKAFRAEIHEQLVLNAVQQRAIGSKLRITEKAVEKFKREFAQKSTEYLIQDYLVQLPEEPTAQDKNVALIKAKQVYQLLSQDKQLPKNAKSIVYNEPGWRTLNDLPNIFAKTLRSLKVKAVSQPVLAPNGYHVVRLVDKHHQDLNTTQAQQLLMQKNYNDAYPEWIARLRKRAYIKVKLDGVTYVPSTA